MLRTLNSPAESQPNTDGAPSLFISQQKPIFLNDHHNQKNPSEREIEQCEELLQKMIASQRELSSKAEMIMQQVELRNYNKGLGYYKSKNLVLLEYLIQLQFYQLFKINAENLAEGQGLELYKRLAYLKTLMTKLGPVEKKLEYQKNKLLKYSDVVRVKPQQQNKHKNNQEAIEQEEQVDQQPQNEDYVDGEEEIQEEESGEQDALNYQPRPEALIAVKQKKQKQLQSEGKYVAPKISAVLSKEDKLARKTEIQEQRRKAFLIRKFRGDLEDDEEAREVGVGNEIAQKIKRKFQDKISAEEENFMRMPETKKEKFWRKSLIRNQQRSNALQDEFKQIQAIKQIFSEKQRPSSVSTQLKRSAPKGKVSGGKKKVKRNE